MMRKSLATVLGTFGNSLGVKQTVEAKEKNNKSFGLPEKLRNYESPKRPTNLPPPLMNNSQNTPILNKGYIQEKESVSSVLRVISTPSKNFSQTRQDSGFRSNFGSGFRITPNNIKSSPIFTPLTKGNYSVNNNTLMQIDEEESYEVLRKRINEKSQEIYFLKRAIKDLEFKINENSEKSKELLEKQSIRYKDDINDLTIKMEKYKEDYNIVKSELLDIGDHFNQLKNQNNELRQNLSLITKQYNEEIVNKNINLNDKYKIYENENSELKARINSINIELSNLEDEFNVNLVNDKLVPFLLFINSHISSLLLPSIEIKNNIDNFDDFKVTILDYIQNFVANIKQLETEKETRESKIEKEMNELVKQIDNLKKERYKSSLGNLNNYGDKVQLSFNAEMIHFDANKEQSNSLKDLNIDNSQVDGVVNIKDSINTDIKVPSIKKRGRKVKASGDENHIVSNTDKLLINDDNETKGNRRSQRVTRQYNPNEAFFGQFIDLEIKRLKRVNNKPKKRKVASKVQDEQLKDISIDTFQIDKTSQEVTNINEGYNKEKPKVKITPVVIDKTRKSKSEKTKGNTTSKKSAS